MNLNYKEEYFSDEIVNELAPLTKLSWSEADCIPNAHFDPDWEKYTQLNELNLLRLFTVRNQDKELVGYITFFVGPTLHSKNVHHALHDSMYILKPYRKNGTAKSLISFVENIFKDENVNTMIVTVMTHRDFSPTLKHLGFTHTESSFIKRVS